MPIFKNHRGQFNGMNTALVALTSLYVIGAAVALSSPYWASSYPVLLAPLAAFAATPLGMFMLAAPAIILAGLALYAISKNNKVSEEKAPKLVNYDGQVMLQVTRDVFEEMKENNKNKDKDGNVIKGEHYIDFSLDKKDYRVIVGDKFAKELGNTLLFTINSLKVKDSNGNFAEEKLETLGLKQSSDEINTYLGELSSVQSAAPQKKEK